MKTHKVRPVLLSIKDQDYYPILGINAFDKNKELYLIQGNRDNSLDFYYHQLILVSLEDEKIEVGDAALDVWNNEMIIMDSATKNVLDSGMLHNPHLKVIATQDQLSPELIQQLIDEYNDGGMKDFEIEIDVLKAWDNIKSVINDPNKIPDNILIKPKLINDFVTVVEKEPILYTEDEVYSLLSEAFSKAAIYGGFIHYYGTRPEKYAKEWFNKNKKKFS